MDVPPGPGLDAFFRPRNVAVVGASRRRGSIGRQVFENLLSGAFTGAVYPVNPKASSVCGVRAYATVADIPDDVDLAVIVVPAELVLDVAEQCGAAGVKALVIISAGFRESGAAGAAREAELMRVVQRHGMRAIGPNCMGILTTDPDVSMNATFSPAKLQTGGLAFVSQSGALGLAILDMAEELGLGLRHFVSLGNRMDVSSNDLLDAWEDDDSVTTVLLYLEHFGNPRNFIDVARRTAKKKPVLAVKSGRSAAGARAARSHTGAMAERDVLAEALFEQCGVIRAYTIEQLFDLARVFGRAPPPRGDRVAILTNSGGPGIMATDALDEQRLRLAELSDATREALGRILPAEASRQNPVDMTAGAGPDAYGAAMDALLADPNVDSLLVIYTPPTYVDDAAVVDAILHHKATEKPLLACVLGRGERDTAFHTLTNAGLPTFTFPESAIRALATYVRYEERRRRDDGTVTRFPDIDHARAAGIIEDAIAKDREWLDAEAAFALLAAYGINVAAPRMATGADDAAALATQIHGPVVMKAVAPGLVHKTEHGGVRTGLLGTDKVRDAYHAMEERMRSAGYTLDGVVLQEEIRPGRETILGATIEPMAGPMLMFGLGGVHAEVFRDVVFRLAPLTDQDAERMVRGIRAWPLLAGHRGEAPADVRAVVETLQRLSRLVEDHDPIRELDANPVIVHEQGQGAVVVDVRIRLWPGGHPPRAPSVVAELSEPTSGHAADA